jgi:RNAse (barnase) inhibitor barstar
MYFLADKSNRDLFYSFCKKMGIKYYFGEYSQDKLPDIILRLNNHFFIIEAKHIKESGGAQDKQIKELIQFISESEKADNIHYLSFMDGTYFNNFIFSSENTKNKFNKQREDIEKNLKKNPKNFFVNTKGFIYLIQDVIQI